MMTIQYNNRFHIQSSKKISIKKTIKMSLSPTQKPLQPKRSPSQLQPISPLQTPPPAFISPLPNTYIEQLKLIYTNSNSSYISAINRNKIMSALDGLMNIFYKANLFFFVEQSQKMSSEDFKNFLAELVLVKKDTRELLVERNKKANAMFVLVEGFVEYWVKNGSQEDEGIMVGVGQAGFLVYPEIFMSPRYANFTIKCQSPCTFLSLTEQVYNKYLKKQITRQTDKLAEYLSQISIFNKMSAINLRKYLSFMIPKYYRYNQQIYEAESPVDHLYFILKGQVQIYTKGSNINQNNQNAINNINRNQIIRSSISNGKDQKDINIVFLGEKECFGVDSWDNGQYSRTHVLNAKSRDAELRVLTLSYKVFKIIVQENEGILQNFESYIRKIEKLHKNIASRNIKMLDLTTKTYRKPQKKKKKKQKGNKISLTWWGLAQDIKTEHKYRMPSHSKPKASHDSIENQHSLMQHKINKLKRRLIEGQQAVYEKQKQNYYPAIDGDQDSGTYVRGDHYVPKIKARIRVLEARPLAVDMAQAVKKKLIMYAKNMGSFCDRLNLE